jgi:UDP-N-acetylglucosamine diphosphorylase/glucosamine-1-phosphate N-acetyltransferase
MNLILFDDPAIRINLLPFTFTRPVGSIRVGILTIAEKWEKWLQMPASFSTEDYLQKKFPLRLTTDNLWINGAICPDDALVKQIKALKKSEGLVQGKQVIALRTPEDEIPEVIQAKMIPYEGEVRMIDQVWKIFQLNGEQIKFDFEKITAGRKSAGIQDPHTRCYADHKIFVEEDVYIRAAILNAEEGPIYLGKNSIVQEGAIIKGPFALCEGGHLNMGAKMRGNVTVGPYSKVGGEVSSSVVFSYSNKAHDGFLGCSVIGEWCNLGADTNTSNMKNNYDNVKLWNYAKKELADTGSMFVGLMMGDHSKSGINTMFNTGTTVGVSANIFGGGFPPKFIPSFAWGAIAETETFRLPKAFETAAKAMGRRSLGLSETDQEILQKIFELEAGNRVWESKK